MNMQKMGKLCKENMSMKLYRKGCTQYISDGITMVEIPRNFPALCDENEAAAVFGWTDKQLDEISCKVEELDVINDLYEVTGISMDDVSGEEIPCKKAPIGFTYAGMRLLVLRDERGGIAGINERQMEPIMDELKKRAVHGVVQADDEQRKPVLCAEMRDVPAHGGAADCV